jgi:predicted nucleic acid-binding protein
MTTYLLDTNACIALINGAEATVRRRFRRAVGKSDVMLLSSVVAFDFGTAPFGPNSNQPANGSPRTMCSRR